MNASHAHVGASRLFRDQSEAVRGYAVSTFLLTLVVASLMLAALVFPTPDIVNVIIRQIPMINEVVTVESIERALARGRARQSQTENGIYVPRKEITKPERIQLIVPPEIDLPIIDNTNLPIDNGWGNPDGKPDSRNRETENSRNRKLETTFVMPEVISDEVIEFAEIDPAFDYEMLQRSVRYPELARRNGVEGQVIVRALVEKNGTASQVEIYSTDHVLLDQEALRSVRSIVFTPGKQNGSAVRCWVMIPIQFRLR